MSTTLHRLLDEAFAGIEMTEQTRDLKEEIRANLLARASELEGAGMAPDEAARHAVSELGDVRELIDTAPRSTPSTQAYDDVARHRVRPSPTFVVRTVLLSLVAACCLARGVLGLTAAMPLAAGGVMALFGGVAVAIGLLVGDSLHQETTTNHPMPGPRATAWGLATALLLAGLGLVALLATERVALWGIAPAAVGAVGGILLFSYLGATQTNRHKAWVRREWERRPPDRFTADPDAAARFGIYTATLWILGLGLFLVLGLTISWWWGGFALLVTLALWMIVLARMLFGTDASK